MADCHVRSSLNVLIVHQIWNKPRLQGRPRGSVRVGGKMIQYYKKRKKRVMASELEVAAWLAAADLGPKDSVRNSLKLFT